MEMRGHTLVWYASNPPWLEEEVLTTRKERVMTDHIEAVIGRYRGRIRSWDVVNEALWPQDGRADGLRDNFWLKAFGVDYIDLAYHAARAADPEALLVYNDWGFEQGGPDNDRFRAVTLRFLEGALARGVPIQALGVQGHLSAFGQPVDQKKLAAFLGAVRQMGLTILVTEHDVHDGGGPSDEAVRDRAVADASRRFLDIVLEHGSPSAVLTWGLTDKYLRPDSFKERMLGDWPRKLPLDAELRRKPMWAAIRSSFEG
jgi:endo-1,4-beta-xylanase